MSWAGLTNALHQTIHRDHMVEIEQKHKNDTNAKADVNNRNWKNIYQSNNNTLRAHQEGAKDTQRAQRERERTNRGGGQ